MCVSVLAPVCVCVGVFVAGCVWGVSARVPVGPCKWMIGVCACVCERVCALCLRVSGWCAQSGRRLLGTNGGSLWLWCCLAQPGALGP